MNGVPKPWATSVICHPGYWAGSQGLTRAGWLQVVVQDVVVAQSGTLPPGNRLEALPLSEGVRLSPGQYEGRFTIWFYHPDGSRAQVSTEVPIALTVL